MGMFDFLFDKEKAKTRQIEKLRKKLTNIWVQSPDRYLAAEQLRDLNDDEAWRAMLDRFKTQVKNTTYDTQEKLDMCDMFVTQGGARVIPVVQGYIRANTNHINFPMRILDDLMPSNDMAEFLTTLLSEMDIEYERDPEKKEQLILRAEKFKDFDELKEQVARFVADDNETIRFLAVNQVLNHSEDPWDSLRVNLRFEDSGRILNLVCERFRDTDQCALENLEDQDAREDLTERLPNEYFLTEEGFIRPKV